MLFLNYVIYIIIFYSLNTRGGIRVSQVSRDILSLIHNEQHEIKTKRFICVKQIKSSFFNNNENECFYS